MIQVQKDEFERLKKAGLIKDNFGEKNYVIVNRGKKSSHKKYFVVEDDRKIMLFLGISKK